MAQSRRDSTFSYGGSVGSYEGERRESTHSFTAKASAVILKKIANREQWRKDLAELKKDRETWGEHEWGVPGTVRLSSEELRKKEEAEERRRKEELERRSSQIRREGDREEWMAGVDPASSGDERGDTAGEGGSGGEGHQAGMPTAGQGGERETLGMPVALQELASIPEPIDTAPPRPWFAAYETASQAETFPTEGDPFHHCFQLFAVVTDQGHYGVKKEDVGHFLGVLGLELLSEGAMFGLVEILRAGGDWVPYGELWNEVCCSTWSGLSVDKHLGREIYGMFTTMDEQG